MRRATNRFATISLAVLILTATSLAEQGPAPSTTQPSGSNAPPASESVYSINGMAKTLFAPRTEEEYFSPFDIMNPEHMRADMPLRIGGVEDLDLYMGLQTVGRLQALQQQNVYIAGAKQAGLDPGFQDPFANLSFLASIPNKLDVYFDLYIASRPHPNTMYAHEGYLLFKQLPAPFDAGPLGQVFNYVNLKVGAFDLDFGDDNYRRSNNAQRSAQSVDRKSPRRSERGRNWRRALQRQRPDLLACRHRKRHHHRVFRLWQFTERPRQDLGVSVA